MPGTPGRPPGTGARPAGGRGAPGRAGSAGGRGARDVPMPCEDEKGLLPGRGPPGRRSRGAPLPGRPPVEPGRGRGPGACPVLGSAARAAGGGVWPGARGTPGRGPGVRCGSACGARAAGAVGAAGRTEGAGGGATAAGGTAAGGTAAGGPTGAGGTTTGGGVTAVGRVSTRGAGTAGVTRSAGLAGRATGAGASTAAVGVASGALRADFLTGGGSLASFSLSRLSTGASTVEDAERTNSPMSFNMVRTILLSTPSSFASS